MSTDVNGRASLVHSGRWAEADEALLGELDGASGARALELVECPRPPASTPAPAPSHVVGLARCAAARAVVLANAGHDRAAAVRHADEAFALAGEIDPDTFWHSMLVLLHAEELDRVEDECRVLARSPRHRTVVPLLLARVLALSGDLTNAHGVLSGVVERTGSSLAVAWLVEVMAELGHPDRAVALLESRGLRGAMRGAEHRAHLLAARGAAGLAAGRFRPALQDLLDAGRVLASLGVRNPSVVMWQARAALCASALRQPDLAVALAEEQYAAAQRWNSPWGRATALHALAIARTDERSMQRLQHAIELVAAGRAQGGRTRMCYDLAVLLRERQSFRDAESLLDTAMQAARSAGNVTWADRVARATEAVVSARTTAGGRLSSQEITTARLARSGLSNREIAAQLCLTTRTVEHHLSGVYQKLGISGRPDLAFALGALS
ncbi:helix-turn-helix transcriptional regulator [Lentzea sp. NBRC 102530]|uniref:helix-turn-helix transcriptional regulator n=1 Tax=Lentzea sp. NBRC 102530 TaxID=3032201 RepID=UPI0025530310|nr:helix-turn-helix transcriptional regulator [Lentzea sp. NBRC 102530]